jgi:hypothetical protein
MKFFKIVHAFIPVHAADDYELPYRYRILKRHKTPYKQKIHCQGSKQYSIKPLLFF